MAICIESSVIYRTVALNIAYYEMAVINEHGAVKITPARLIVNQQTKQGNRNGNRPQIPVIIKWKDDLLDNKVTVIVEKTDREIVCTRCHALHLLGQFLFVQKFNFDLTNQFYSDF